MRIPYQDVESKLKQILINEGLVEDRAKLIAQIFTDASTDGYHSHGVNRFCEFVKNIRRGIIIAGNDPVLQQSLGAIEQWDGQFGPGPSNAHFAMGRAIDLARVQGMSCVALANTNHWMRGGTYGWQAAEADCLAICFTNTMPNMAPWGGMTHTTGNNPLIIAVPRKEGHLVLDMSMTQFSYGQLYKHRLEGKMLPLSGGYDEKGQLTNDPSKILETKRLLPTGYWKGSGLSLMLDLLATLLSRGQSTADIGKRSSESALSQIFICIEKSKLGSTADHDQLVNQIVAHFTSSVPEKDAPNIRYPGSETQLRRKRNRREGIPINEEIWKKVLELEKI